MKTVVSFLTQRSGRKKAERVTWAVVAWSMLGLSACAPDAGSLPSAESNQPTATDPVDLQVQLLGAPSPSYTSEAITLTTTVRNAGLASAAGLQLSLTVPATAQVQHQPEGPGWTCTQVATDGTASCTKQSQGELSESEVWLALLPELTAQSLTATAAVTAVTADPDLTNNRAMAVVPIMYDAASYRAPAVAGGGFGCANSGRSAAPLPATLLFTTLAAIVLLVRRRADPAPRS